MPNFPSIYLELQELWKRIRGLVSQINDIQSIFDELERITQCMDYVTSPTNSTVFACDVRLSGSGDPDLYVDGNIETEGNLIVAGNITTEGNLIVSGSTTLGNPTTPTDSLTINIGSYAGELTVNGLGNAATTTGYKVLTIDNTTGLVKKEDFSDVVTAGGGANSYSSVLISNTDDANTTFKVTQVVTIPSTARFVRITCIGGGGGGGRGISNERGGGGGGGGAYSTAIYRRSTLPSVLTGSAGGGGVGSTSGDNGGPGGGSCVVADNKVICYAAGGWGGASGSNYLSSYSRRGPPGKGEFDGAWGNTVITSTDWDYFMQK